MLRGSVVSVYGVFCLFAAALACEDDEAHSDQRADAAVRRVDAGKPPPDPSMPSIPSTARFATASATLTELSDAAADSGSIALAAQARFRQTSESVDMEIALQGCEGEAAYAVAILEASDCSAASRGGAPKLWADGLPTLTCAGTGVGQAGAGYSRLNRKKAPWTVGDGSPSDVVGHALVIRGRGAIPVACGVIERGEDVEPVPLPPADHAPSLATRAAIGGACYQRQFAGASARCPDDAAVVRCEATHCDIGSCLKTCEQYASCLDQQPDACAATGACTLSAECADCQNKLRECSLQFCADDAVCGASPTPDGPCQRLAGCCALQGPEASTCMAVLLPLLSSLGGDANCIGSMMDWDVLTHLHVPCTYGPLQLPTSPGNAPSTMTAAEPLADQHAGIACTSDADCPGGACAAVPAHAAAASGESSGYCTRPCEATAECGTDGMCAGGASAKQCFAACRDQSECLAGFVCTGGVQGARIVLSGSCRPERQPDQLEDGVAGRACASDAECGGGACASENLLGTAYPGNYCSARCYDDAHCGEGGVCLWTRASSDPGYCLQRCSSDAQCTREDYGCWELNDGTRALHACYPRMRPLPDRRAGTACTSDAECGAPHAYCAKKLPAFGLATNELVDVPGGYCTQRCALDIECGADAQCINYGTSGGLCFASCSLDKTCRAGYTCDAHARDNDMASVCVAAMP